MMLLKWVVRPYLYLEYGFQMLTRQGAFGRDQAVYATEPWQPSGNPIRDGLFQYHIKQFHESSCSVATMASVVNTLLACSGSLKGSPVTQQDLLEKVRTAHWKERMSDTGYKGRRGLPLEVLGQVVRSSLDTFDVPYQSVETVQTLKDPAKSGPIRETLKSRLTRFRTEGSCLVIAHFDQGQFIRDLHIPHISPVGDYDPQTGTVTLLDVDPSQEHPYRISFDTFYKGLSNDYNQVFRFYGYGEGGYVLVRL